jgi:type IV secretion system protein TrbL
MSWTRFIFLMLACVPLFSWGADGNVWGGETSPLDQITIAFRDSTQEWEPIIQSLTMGLFWGLVTISFAWSSCQLLLKGAGLVDVIADLTTRVMTVGVAVWLITSAPYLGRVLIESFQEIGQRLAPEFVAFSPANVVEMGINLVLMTIKKSSFIDIGLSLMLFVCAIIILICYILIALEMTVLIVTSYVTVSGGIVMMGFLGSEWTKDNAMNYFTAVLGVAVRMFVMQLILILGYGFIKKWTNQMTNSSQDLDYLVLLAIAMVFYGMIREIPNIAASLASGRFTMTGGGLAAAVTGAAGLAAGAALAATGVGAAALGAMSGSETKDNEDAILKHSLNTGGDAPSSAGGQAADPMPSAGSEKPAQRDSGPAQEASTGQRVMGALGRGAKELAKAGGTVAKDAAVAGLKAVASQSAIGGALAKSGIEIGKLDSSQAKHEALMKAFNIKSKTPPAE